MKDTNWSDGSEGSKGGRERERERWSHRRAVPGTAAYECSSVAPNVSYIYASLARFSFVLLFNQNLRFLINKETQKQADASCRRKRPGLGSGEKPRALF